MTDIAPHAAAHDVRPSDIAVGVILGRSSEFFDFFVFAIASVIVFPGLLFPYMTPLDGTLWSFAIFALAFVARPFGTVIFTEIDRAFGKNVKLVVALFLLGSSTVAMGLLPGYQEIGHWAAVLLCILRIGQGIALGGSWDGLPSLLNIHAPEGRKGFYAMVPQLGAPVGLIVAALLFAYLIAALPAADFLDWGWRYPFFVAFAINVVALFARLRIVVSPEYQAMYESRDLEPTPVVATLRSEGRGIVLGAFAPLASFALFHIVTVFPLSWVFLYTSESPVRFLMLEALGAVVGLGAIVASAWLADRFGRRSLLFWGGAGIAVFSLLAPVLLNAGAVGETIFLLYGFALLGLNFGQSSGAIASLFAPGRRYTASALVSDLAWLFGAGFAPLAALMLSAAFGLFASGFYLLSGAVCTMLALHFARLLEARRD
ncbi:MFS transporter [Stagnihabitans tardus]|uniref:MFS transporter n=1 Tax=Stagnihabitans tardus TaxID=2699202 RepID=A0AAE4Y880_9RHOB|nr:MFS transporter [Stagnihabitans tardus]NBZ87751.1 MFS transporter [Stagnihabitans tardus]